MRAGRLPQVSWIVAPEAFTEHPNWPANYGAWYIAKVLDALTADPEVWSRTALLLTYDENDGFFDHVVPAVPARLRDAGRLDRVHRRRALPRLGRGGRAPTASAQRVPMVVVSPWSTGGWVCSQTFDHTSIIRLMEARFGVPEPDITPWRRTVCGDLTATLAFDRRRTTLPALPRTSGYRPTDAERHPDYVPVPPEQPRLPVQEPGVRPSRALGYDLDVTATPTPHGLDLTVTNRGRCGAQLQARSPHLPTPCSYTVAAGTRLHAHVPFPDAYDLSVHGPNGFFRRFAGRLGGAAPEVTAVRRHEELVLEVRNDATRPVRLELTDRYAHRRPRAVTVAARSVERVAVPTEAVGGWYDVRLEAGADEARRSGRGDTPFVRHLAGRVETGRDSISDPQLGRGSHEVAGTGAPAVG